MGKGYSEVVPPPPTPVKSKEEIAAHKPFLDEILKDPDNLDSLNIYADWLIERDDPRGQLIRTQLQLEEKGLSADERKTLKAKEESLIKQHGREWLGPNAARFFIDQLQPEDEEGWLNPEYKFTFVNGLFLSLEFDLVTRVWRRRWMTMWLDLSVASPSMMFRTRTTALARNSCRSCPILFVSRFLSEAIPTHRPMAWWSGSNGCRSWWS